MQFVSRDTDVLVELETFFLPILKPFHPLLCPAKIFEFHLLELARTKSEIARINFVPKRFADLSDAEWQLLARNLEDIFELHENGLRRFWTEVSQRCRLRFRRRFHIHGPLL